MIKQEAKATLDSPRNDYSPSVQKSRIRLISREHIDADQRTRHQAHSMEKNLVPKSIGKCELPLLRTNGCWSPREDPTTRHIFNGNHIQKPSLKPNVITKNDKFLFIRIRRMRFLGKCRVSLTLKNAKDLLFKVESSYGSQKTYYLIFDRWSSIDRIKLRYVTYDQMLRDLNYSLQSDMLVFRGNLKYRVFAIDGSNTNSNYKPNKDQMGDESPGKTRLFNISSYGNPDFGRNKNKGSLSLEKMGWMSNTIGNNDGVDGSYTTKNKSKFNNQQTYYLKTSEHNRNSYSVDKTGKYDNRYNVGDSTGNGHGFTNRIKLFKNANANAKSKFEIQSKNKAGLGPIKRKYDDLNVEKMRLIKLAMDGKDDDDGEEEEEEIDDGNNVINYDALMNEDLEPSIVYIANHLLLADIHKNDFDDDVREQIKVV